MAKRYNTAGMKLLYAAEATAGTRPTQMSAYTHVPEITGVPDMSPAPNTADVTPIDETEAVQYIDLLKDFGATLDFSCNWSDTIDTAWNTTLVGAYETAAQSNKAVWFCIMHPTLSKAVYFKGKPLVSGFNEVSPNSPLTGTLRIAYEGGFAREAKPTA